MNKHGERVRVGVLSLHNSKESKAILNAVEALGHTPKWLREENTRVRIVDGAFQLAPDVDVVANQLLLSNGAHPSEGLGIARTLSSHRPMLNDPDAAARASHKTATAGALAAHDVPHPDIGLALDDSGVAALREEFGDEAVFKTAVGTHGSSTWKADATATITAKVGRRRAFLQQLVGDDADPRDVRVYVVDGEVVGAMFRYAPEGDWRTNVARGGHAEGTTDRLPDVARTLALDATQVLGLDYAGVDLIEADGEWLVLEVNPTAGFKGLFSATGVSPAPHIARLAIERAGGEVDEAVVRDLARTLDDTTPTCKPRLAEDTDGAPNLVGYTERVTVRGVSGTETVVGKCDSGAARTSIGIDLATDIGAGPIHTVSRVKSGSSKRGKRRPVVDVTVGVDGRPHTVAASVEDRSHMSYPLLIGRDILEHYHLDIARRAETR